MADVTERLLTAAFVAAVLLGLLAAMTGCGEAGEASAG
jgi:hypothetical protein